MNIMEFEQAKRRNAVSEIFGSMIMFALVFTAGIGFFVYVNATTLQGAQANQQKQQAFQQASQEKLSIDVGLSAKTGDLWLRVTNVGGSSVTAIDVFVTNTTSYIVSKSQVTPGTQYLSTFPDLNYSLPLTVLPGFSTAQMNGCDSTPGCDIAISQGSYNYASSGSPVVVSVLTSTGDIFSAQYPSPTGASTVTMTMTNSIYSTSTVGGGNPGGNVLVVQMVATPTQVFSCAHCLNDTVTVYNYGTFNVTGVSLSPAVPLASLTGSANVSSGSCTLTLGTRINGSVYIPAYSSGSGTPPKVVYLCTYDANPNGFGGFVSFTGSARGTYNQQPVTSGEAISNPVQIGGPVSVLNQGPFSANFFFFKYSACTTLPNGGTPCRTAPSPVKSTDLLTASRINGSSSYYVAFYIQITNNYDATIPILPYTYFLTDPTAGGESPFFIVGNPGNNQSTSDNPNLPYIPNYNTATPTLTPYPSTCLATSTASCINIAPGDSAVITFAACDIGSTWWDWGGSAYGNSFDHGNTCTTYPPSYEPNESTYLSILITFAYNGQVYTQQIPFVGQWVS